MSIEERLEILESVVSKSAITLTDSNDSTRKIILNFSSGNFTIVKQTTVTEQTEIKLTEIETENEN